MTVLSIGNKTEQNRVYTEPYWNHHVMALLCSRVREPLSTTALLTGVGEAQVIALHLPCLVTSSQGQVQQQLKAKSR